MQKIAPFFCFSKNFCIFAMKIILNFKIMADKLKNYELFLKKLSQIGVETTKLNEEFGEKIENAPFSNLETTGMAYEGALINTLLYKLTPYAIKINEMFPTELQVDKNSLIKVCLLHQIAKSIRLEKNDNDWEIKNRGMIYKYAPNQPSIRAGLHSLIMSTNCGIQFTAEEAEAMTINDRDLSDDQARWHASIMASIVRQANEMVYLEANNSTKTTE